MVAVLFGRVLGAGLARDVVAERADLALELARLVAAVDPVGDLGGGRLDECWLKKYNQGKCKRVGLTILIACVEKGAVREGVCN